MEAALRTLLFLRPLGPLPREPLEEVLRALAGEVRALATEWLRMRIGAGSQEGLGGSAGAFTRYDMTMSRSSTTWRRGREEQGVNGR